MMPYFNFHKTYLLIQDPSDRFKFLSSKWVALNLQPALRIQELLTPWLQIMLKQVEIGDSTCTGRIASQIMQLMHKALF